MISHIIVLLICFIGLVEAIQMALVDWEDLAISVRKSPRKLYNVLKDELGLPEWNELSVIERRSMKKRYAVIRDSFPELPPGEELSVMDRRSHKSIYRVIKSVNDGDYDDCTAADGPPAAVIPQKDIPLEEEGP